MKHNGWKLFPDAAINKISVLIFVFFLLGGAAQATTFVVNSTADLPDANVGDGFCSDGTGNCTLRAAIEEANFTAASDTINFGIAPFDGSVKTIAPNSALPFISQPVVINGYSQTGSSANTQTISDNAVLLIELNGANVGAGVNGIVLSAGDCSVSGLIINRFSRNGISINGGDDNNISGNFIGTDATGMLDLGNGGVGIEGEFGAGSSGNVIGGTTPAERNIVSGNDGEAGIQFNFAGNNLILGNFVGLAADGATAIGNTRFGVVAGAFTGGTIIGGDDAFDGTADGIVAARNYISGNGFAGIFIGGAAFGGSTIHGNYIGTDTTGTLARGNGAGIASNIGNGSIIGGTTAGAGNLVSGNTGDGMSFGFTSNLNIQANFIGMKADGISQLGNGGDGIEIVAGGSGNQIGGTGAGAGNVIAFNSEDGVQIDDVGVTPVGNPILGNSIFSNGGLGINLSIDGVTQNDAGDADAGANRRQNFPLISDAQPGNARVIGTFNSTANTTFRLEFFNSSSADASGFGEGQIFIGAINVTTDAGGNTSFDQIFPFNVTLNSYISATATDLTTNDTSEFSASKLVTTTTAAPVSVGGRVSDSFGRGVSGARVKAADSNGNLRETLTNSFGYYSFNNLAAGETYFLTTVHKNHQFSTQIISANEDREDINFIAAGNFK